MKFQIVGCGDSDAPDADDLSAGGAADSAPAASGRPDDTGTADDPGEQLKADTASIVASIAADAESISERMAEITAIAGRTGAARRRKPPAAALSGERPPDNFRAHRFSGRRLSAVHGGGAHGRATDPDQPTGSKENGGQPT